MLTKCFGLDEGMSTVDTEPCSYLIQLRQLANAFDDSTKQSEEMILFAERLVRTIDHLQVRLKSLMLKARFANNIYDLFCALGSPKRAYDTLVKAALNSSVFRQLTFNLKANPLSPSKASTSPSAKNVRPGTFTPQKHSREAFAPSNASSTLVSITSSGATSTVGNSNASPKAVGHTSARASSGSKPPGVATTPTVKRTKDERMAAYPKSREAAEMQFNLEVKGEAIDITRISSMSEEATKRLQAQVLQGSLVPVKWEAYYAFGFATTQDAKEETDLGGIYRGLLEGAQKPEAMFAKLALALETSTIVNLLDSEDWGTTFGERIPQLDHFLNTPPAERPSV